MIQTYYPWDLKETVRGDSYCIIGSSTDASGITIKLNFLNTMDHGLATLAELILAKRFNIDRVIFGISLSLARILCQKAFAVYESFNSRELALADIDAAILPEVDYYKIISDLVAKQRDLTAETDSFVLSMTHRDDICEIELVPKIRCTSVTRALPEGYYLQGMYINYASDNNIFGRIGYYHLLSLNKRVHNLSVTPVAFHLCPEEPRRDNVGAIKLITEFIIDAVKSHAPNSLAGYKIPAQKHSCI